MKKMLFTLLISLPCHAAIAQHSIFMQILENKKICNKEDELTYFLQANSFVRNIENQYQHHYAVAGTFYTTTIINDNECYAIYRTNNVKDYNKIKATITTKCSKELAADKTVCYVCDAQRMRDVQIMFSGYSEKDKNYEILIYQNPQEHELPYHQSDRVKVSK